MKEKKFFQLLWRIQEKGRIVLLVIFVLLFIGFEWHLIPMELITKEGIARKIIISGLIVLGAGVIVLLFETRTAVEEVSKDVKQIEENAGTRLQSLETCMGEISDALDGLSTKDKILVKHLGLNMEHAWDYLRKYFLENKNVKNIEVRLLMLPDESDEIKTNSKHPVPSDVVAWCKSVNSRIKQIEKYLDSQKTQMQERKKIVTIDIKQYKVLPTFHGFSVSGSINICCLSVCRYKPNKQWEYDWGQFSYHTINQYTTDSGVMDLNDIFEGLFEYLWETSENTGISFSTDKKTTERKAMSPLEKIDD